MDSARDLFMIGAYTGLRVSDFNRLTKSHIKVDGDFKYIEIKTKKTGKVVVIPINSIVQKILDKRNGNPPNKMPDQNINMLLKKIGEKAKLNETIQIEKTIVGKKTIIKKLKSDLITNHTARRSFATNAYKAGLPTYDIMQITSHKTEKTFYKYIKITPLEALRKTAKHEFFN
jgi:integrase